MRNQAIKANGGYRGEVTRDGRSVAQTARVFRNRNAAAIEAWKLLLDIRGR